MWFIMLLLGCLAAYLLYLAPWREWYDWLNPNDFSKGLINGKKVRMLAEMDAQDKAWRERKAAEHEEWMKANIRIDEKMAAMKQSDQPPQHARPGAHLRTHQYNIDGTISAAPCAPDAEFIRRYGSPKTMTLETLEKLIEERKAAKDAEFEGGF